MIKVYEASDWLEAQLVFDWLTANQLKPELEGVFRQGALGQLPVNAMPSLWVEEEDADKAVQAIGLFHARQEERQRWADWVCPDCGELSPASMDSCWNCGRER